MNLPALFIAIGAVIFLVAVLVALWLVDEFTPRNFFDDK